jgi:DeoR/GlpR family transcriptional regulator of sugar metabolism
MLKAQRQHRILEILNAEGAVTIAKLAVTMPEVSQVTLRRDLSDLAEAGSLRRTHGGAVLPDAQLLKQPGAVVEQVNTTDEIDDLDAVILPPIPGRGGDALRRHIAQRGIPFLAESAPQKDGVYLGPDNFAAGYELGCRAASYAPKECIPRVLVVGHPELENTRERVLGFLQGIKVTLRRPCEIVSVNGRGAYKTALRVASDAIASSGPFDVALGVNDHSAIAIAEAATQFDQNISVFAMGGESAAFVARLANRRKICAVAAFFPEKVGERAIDMIVGALQGQTLPELAITPHAIVDADNLEEFYEKTNAGWQLRDSRLTHRVKPVLRSVGANRPRVGFIPHFPAHDWYRAMIQTMQARAIEHGLDLIVIPPHKGISSEISRLRGEIAKTACDGLVAGETILIGEGEATHYLAEEICQTAFRDPTRLRGLTVITNALDVMFRLDNAPGIKTILTGGEYQSADRCLVGPSLGALFERIRADRAYLSVAGLSHRFGLSSMDQRLALVGSQFVEAANRTIALADHTVIGADATHRIARLEDFDEVITDDGALPNDRQAIRASDVMVRVAGDDHQSIEQNRRQQESNTS